MKHLIQSCKGVGNCLEHCPCDCHTAELRGGVTQALAERERILGIIEEEYKKHDEEKLCDCRATSAIDDILTRIKI